MYVNNIKTGKCQGTVKSHSYNLLHHTPFLLFWGSFPFRSITINSVNQVTNPEIISDNFLLCPVFTSYRAFPLQSILFFVVYCSKTGSIKAIRECTIMGKGEDIRGIILLISLLFMTLMLCHLFNLN